ADLRFVTDNLMATLLTLYADEIRVGSVTIKDHLELVHDHLLQSDNKVRNSSSVATITSHLITTPQYRALRLHHLFTTNQLGVEAELTVVSSELLYPLGVKLPRNGFQHVAAFVHQALSNVYEHGFLDQNNAAIPGARYLRFRVLELDPLSGGQPLPVAMSQYLARFEAIGAKPDHFLEISIADSGRGIAATMAGASGDTVFDLPVAHERSRFTLALQPGGSSRPSAPGGGRGLVIMTRAIHELRGFLAFRTGRLFVCRHFLARDGRLEPSRFDETDLTFYRTYDWLGEDLRRASGTAVTALIPLVNVQGHGTE
ncbi:MAG: hypothetical protein LC808_32475, partial [Actinobacteria bacterium]|nr:hypothetical protein [Actinomycetota bacterium]